MKSGRGQRQGTGQKGSSKSWLEIKKKWRGGAVSWRYLLAVVHYTGLSVTCIEIDNFR